MAGYAPHKRLYEADHDYRSRPSYSSLHRLYYGDDANHLSKNCTDLKRLQTALDGQIQKQDIPGVMDTLRSRFNLFENELTSL